MGTKKQVQQMFNYEGNEVRTISSDGQVWFVAKDVCDVLEIGNPSQALTRLDKDEKNTIILNEGIRGNPNTTIINEPGLYSLILGSRKPEAKQFKRWVTHEVLPAIRKHGGYLTPEKIEEALLNPDTIIQLATALKEEQLKRKVAEREALLMKPKADKYTEFLDADGTITFTTLGKHFLGGLTAAQARKYLQDRGILFNRKVDGAWQPKKGYEEFFRTFPYIKNNKILAVSTKITPKGIDFILNIVC